MTTKEQLMTYCYGSPISPNHAHALDAHIVNTTCDAHVYAYYLHNFNSLVYVPKPPHKSA